MNLSQILTQLVTFIRMTIMDLFHLAETAARLVAWTATVHPAVFFAVIVVALVALFVSDELTARK